MNPEKFGLKLIGKTLCDDEEYELDVFSGEEFLHEDGALRVIINDVWVSWVLLETLSYSETRTTYTITGYGEGPSGNLREPRHTYLGKEGYLFYVSPKLLNWCFQKLSKWFDYN